MPNYALNPQQLWSLPFDAFNEWRRKNDLPDLLEYFKRTLPRFESWQSEFKIDDSTFLAVDTPSHFFYGHTKLYVHCGGKTFDPTPRPYISANTAETIYRGWTDEVVSASLRIQWSRAFLPYFHWLRKREKIRYFKVALGQTHAHLDNLEYRSWMEDPKTKISRASLLDFHVLKLGQINIDPSLLDRRNLDFVDLDGLKLAPDPRPEPYHFRPGCSGAFFKNIGYSSCRNIEMTGIEMYFLTFLESHIEHLLVCNSTTQSVGFIDCNMGSPTFRDSRLRLGFRDTLPGQAVISGCDLIEFQFLYRSNSLVHEGVSNLHRILRMAYQTAGKRNESRQHYYLERYYEWRAQVSPLLPQHTNRLRDLLEKRRDGVYETKQVFQIIGSDIKRCFAAVFSWRGLAAYLTRKWWAFFGLCELMIWGFGERPKRVLLSMMAVVLALAVVVRHAGQSKISASRLDSLYCAASFFLTNSCTNDELVRTLKVASVAGGFMGMSLIALFITSLANRSKY